MKKVPKITRFILGILCLVFAAMAILGVFYNKIFFEEIFNIIVVVFMIIFTIEAIMKDV